MEAHTAHEAPVAPPRMGGRLLLARRTDERLVEMVRQGDAAAFEVLYDRYHLRILSFCRHMLGSQPDGEDATQHAFVALHRHVTADDRPVDVKPWLFQVARNCCVDELRRRRRYAIHFSQLEAESNDGEVSVLYDMPDPGPLPEDLMERRDLQQYIQKAIQSLPPKFRSVVLLRYMAQLSFAEIGRTLKMPEATAKTYFHRAKVLLRKVISSDMQTISA